VLARTPRLFGEQHVPAVMLWIAAVERQRGKRDDAMRTATGAMFHWCQWLAVQRPDEADRWTAQADALRAAIAPATSSPNATARTLADTVDAIHRAKDQPEALVRACLALARIVDPADAEPFLRIAAEIVQSDEHTPGRLRGLALAELGRFLLTQRRYADAEPLLDHAITALRDRLGAEDSTVAALEGELAGARRAANGPAAEPNLASPTDGR